MDDGHALARERRSGTRCEPDGCVGVNTTGACVRARSMGVCRARVCVVVCASFVLEGWCGAWPRLVEDGVIDRAGFPVDARQPHRLDVQFPRVEEPAAPPLRGVLPSTPKYLSSHG
jgi:hypothetical protein